MKWIILTFLLVTSMPQAHANIFYHDNRTGAAREPGTPYAPVGVILNMDTRKGGTAFLVGARHILCNYSELMDANYNIRNHIYRFGVGPSGIKNFSEYSTARPIVWGYYFEKGKLRPHEDWVLLELDEPLGDEFGYLKLQPAKLPDASINVKLVGYPEDRDLRELWMDPICHIYGPELNGLWLHDCASRPRNAGSPLLAMTGFRVLAMHTGSLHEVPETLAHFDRAYANYAIPVSQFLPLIRAHVPELH